MKLNTEAFTIIEVFFEVIYITIYEGRESLPYEKYKVVWDGFTSQGRPGGRKKEKKGKLLRH
jgi:hypothetical protein